MKKYILFSILLFAICIAPAFTSEYTWTGEWETNYGIVILEQKDNYVTGTYYDGKAFIRGSVEDSVLIGEWSERKTADSWDGSIEFVMSSDGKSFTGKWKDASGSSWSDWNGTRVK